MAIYQMSDDELISLGEQVLANSQKSPIKEAVAVVGYDEAAFQRGQSLLEVYAASVQQRQSEEGDQLNATGALNDAWDAFHTQTYMPHVTIARLVLERNGTHKRLGIQGRRPKGFQAYINKAELFYNQITLNKDVQETLAARGITPEIVRQAQADLKQLKKLNHQQEIEKSEVQNAIRVRNNSRRAFADWLSLYHQLARVAMSEQPELLEQLGITVRPDTPEKPTALA